MSELRQKQARQRDQKRLEFIRSLPCCICGDNTSTEAAHLRIGSINHGKPNTGMAEKPGDAWTLPLCNKHHREQHQMAELRFWAKYGIDPFLLALALRQS